MPANEIYKIRNERDHVYCISKNVYRQNINQTCIDMFWTIKLCTYANTELFEIELFICIKMDLALNNLQRLIYNKTQTSIKLEY